MQLEGSCSCGEVRFRARSPHPYPFNVCYCSICRKTAGGGGYAINLSAEADTLEVEGRDRVRLYRARIADPQTGKLERSPAERNFCGTCGSALWLWDPRWPELLHPFASAIDSELPVPPERTHLMTANAPRWVQIRADPADKEFPAYPEESIAAWHERLGLVDGGGDTP